MHNSLLGFDVSLGHARLGHARLGPSAFALACLLSCSAGQPRAPSAAVQADPGTEGDGTFEDLGPYSLAPEAAGPLNGAPRGALSDTQTYTSESVYAGWTFDYQVFVPAQYQKGKPAALAVFQDGIGAYGDIEVLQMFENLIHAREMPVTIVLFVNPGSGGRSEEHELWQLRVNPHSG